MTERSYGWLFWGLALTGVLLDQAGKYSVFHWLPPVDHLATKGELPLVGGIFELVTEFTGEPAQATGVRGILCRLNGRMLPKVNRGAVFGTTLTFDPETSNQLFALVSLVAAVAIIFWRGGRRCGRTGDSWSPWA